MKLLYQLLAEYGASLDAAYTVVPDFGGYFKCVKSVEEYAPHKITLSVKKRKLTIFGDNLVIGKYFEQDLFVRGKITGVNFE